MLYLSPAVLFLLNFLSILTMDSNSLANELFNIFENHKENLASKVKAFLEKLTPELARDVVNEANEDDKFWNDGPSLFEFIKGYAYGIDDDEACEVVKILIQYGAIVEDVSIESMT